MLLILLIFLNLSLNIEPAFAWAPQISASDQAQLTTSATVGTSSVQIIDTNYNRLGFLIWNNSANSAYCCFKSTCSSAWPTQIIPTFTTWAWVTPLSYRGPISCIRNSGTGTLTITELQ